MIETAGPILLSSGYAPTEGFPADELADLAASLLRTRAAEALQYGKRDGYEPLRRQIAEWLTADGVPAKSDEIIIITGAKQNLDMTARAFCGPGDEIVMGSPSYMNGIRILERAGARVTALPLNSDGLDVDALERRLQAARGSGQRLPRIVYDIPDFHNPVGTVLPPERREKLVALADDYDLLILEDNPYRWTRFEGEPVAPLKSFDRHGRVISTGTFAKILGPGLRLGWVHATRPILDRIGLYKPDAGTSPLCQMLASDFFAAPARLAAHTAKIGAILRGRRDAMIDALDEHFAELAEYTQPQGGYYIWVSFPEWLDTDRVADEASALGVEVYRGSVFYTPDHVEHHSVRLSFSYEEEDRIRQGIRRLAQAVARVAPHEPIAAG